MAIRHIVLQTMLVLSCISLFHKALGVNRNDQVKPNFLSRFSWKNKLTNRPTSEEDWELYSDDRQPQSSRWIDDRIDPHKNFAPFRKTKLTDDRKRLPFGDLIGDMFPESNFNSLSPSTKKRPNVDEIHVELDDIADLSKLLDYDDISFSIGEKPVTPTINLKNGPKLQSGSKPFWGPPIKTVSTRPPTSIKLHHQSTTKSFLSQHSGGRFPPHLSGSVTNNTRENTLPDLESPSESGNNNLENKRPKVPFWGPVHPWPLHDVQQNNDPFDVSYWNRPTEWARVATTEPAPRKVIVETASALENGRHSTSPLLTNDPSPNNLNLPPVGAKDIRPEHEPWAVAPYSETHHHPPEYHHAHPTPVVTKYQPPSLMKVDFSPLFLALIPLALVLGAAASFALSTAVTSNTAVATAQQQQQQQESSSNNNANSNSNSNTMLSLLAALAGGYNNNQYPYYVIVNGTRVITGRSAKRRKWSRDLLERP